MFVTRSAVTVIDQDGEVVPEQLNQLTGVIQAGNIYGFSDLHARALRLPGSPFLETQDHTHGIFIPSTAQIEAKDGQFAQFTRIAQNPGEKVPHLNHDPNVSSESLASQSENPSR